MKKCSQTLILFCVSLLSNNCLGGSRPTVAEIQNLIRIMDHTDEPLLTPDERARKEHLLKPLKDSSEDETYQPEKEEREDEDFEDEE